VIDVGDDCDVAEVVARYHFDRLPRRLV
jgi:hypothetical protein